MGTRECIYIYIYIYRCMFKLSSDSLMESSMFFAKCVLFCFGLWYYLFFSLCYVFVCSVGWVSGRGGAGGERAARRAIASA